ncbi:MAG: F0F1 ATP synthase subunit A [Caldilineaceae bacterium]
MQLSPDAIIYWQWGPLVLNATIVYTWVVMALLVAVSYGVTRHLSIGPTMSAGQNVLETAVTFISHEIHGIMGRKPDPYLPFIGTLLLFVGVANLLTIVPGYQAPTGSLSTTAALAFCVFFAIPVFGIWRKGVRPISQAVYSPLGFYAALQHYRRAFAHAGSRAPLWQHDERQPAGFDFAGYHCRSSFPSSCSFSGLLIGMIQAYIFAVLATVYISSAVEVTGRGRMKG